MAVLTPNAFLARNITTLTLTAQDVAANGTLSDNALGAKSILLQIRTIRNQQSNTLEEVSGITQRRRNNVILDSGTTYTFTGFLLAGDSEATPTNWAEQISETFDYVKMIFTRNGRTKTFYGVIHTFEDAAEGKGTMPFTMELEMVDPNAANPASA